MVQLSILCSAGQSFDTDSPTLKGIIFFVAACNSETYHLLYVFVGYAGNIIDEVWQQMSQRGVAGTGQNFAGSWRGG